MSLKHSGIGNGSYSNTWVLKCTDLPQFDALVAEADRMTSDDKLHLRNLCNDASRCTGLVSVHRSPDFRTFTLDYSRQRVTGETMEILFDLADAVKMTERREAFRTGRRINVTEDRPVLHHVLRMPDDYPIKLLKGGYRPAPISRRVSDASTQASYDEMLQDGGVSLLKHIHDVRIDIQIFSERIRNGELVSVNGQQFTDVLYVGGSASVGPEFVTEALRATVPLSEQKCLLRFLSNVDPVAFWDVTRDLNPTRTLVILASANFTDTETMLVVRTALNWLTTNLTHSGAADDDTQVTNEMVIASHTVAITDNQVRCRHFGIPKDRTFPYMTMCGRYSLFAPPGILPLALQFGYPVVCEFLKGAHEMDEHFFTSPLYDNIPVILGLLGIWNSTFLGYQCRAVIPYAHALQGLPRYVQKISMESNGKRVALDGTPLLHRSALIEFGHTGTAAHHSIFQVLHQGREIPVDFIGFMENPHPIELDEEVLTNHDELMAHFFAQPDALAFGKTLVDLIQEGAPEPLREHMLFPGNRPSSVMLLTRLDAFALGQLTALYEHRTVVQGFIWGINSFDQFGLDLGQSLAKQTRSQISASRKTGASVQGFNQSTSRLLEQYLAHRKGVKKPIVRHFFED